MIDWVSIVRHSRRRFSNYVGARSPVRIRRRRRQLAAPPITQTHQQQRQQNQTQATTSTTTTTDSSTVNRKVKVENCKSGRSRASSYACCCANGQRVKSSSEAVAADSEILIETANVTQSTEVRANNNRQQQVQIQSKSQLQEEQNISSRDAEDAVSSTSSHLNAQIITTTASTTVIPTSIYNFNLLHMEN